jgi:hypothetical protein
MRLNVRLLLGLSILLALYPLACRADSCANGVQVNRDFIELSGVLHRQVRWGPPNFGENPVTDSTFIAWIISLSEPLVVQGGVQFGGKSQPSVSQIALISYSYKVPFDAERLQPLDGKLVVVTGKLWPATTPEVGTPIILVTKTIKPANQDICRVIPEN